MENGEYKYNAFISYRHKDLDKFVAENLHRLIETYKMPKPVVEKYNITDNDIRRVFRDEDELPLASNLEDPIMEALEESKFLIVICSPRLKESLWCKKEIENFIKMHGRKNILCVLIEGVPKDSFPEILQYYEEEVTTKGGNKETKRIPCEPLAMDVRGNDKKEVYKKLKTELIRIIAPMYNLDYDDIKRRHEERENKRKLNILRIIAIVSILFAFYSFILFFRIYTSSKQLKYDQSINLADQASELLKKDNRRGAIEKSYQSITKINNTKLPVTARGLYELTDSLGLYYLDEFYYPLSQLDTLGVVESIKTDLSKDFLLSYDESGELVLWNVKEEKRIITLKDTIKNMDDSDYCFIGNKALAYLNSEKEIRILDFQGNEITKINLDLIPKDIITSPSGNYLEICDNNTIHLFDTGSYQEVASYTVEENFNIIESQYFDEQEENLIFIVEDENIVIDTKTNGLSLITYNIAEKKVLNTMFVEAKNVKNILFVDNSAIAQFSKKKENGTDMIIRRFDYKTGATYYEKIYIDDYATNIKISRPENGDSTLMVCAFDFAYLFDLETGEEKSRFAFGSSIVSLYTIGKSQSYVLFTTGGKVSIITGNDNRYDDTTYIGFFNFNLQYYQDFIYTNSGILAINNENRIVIYGFLKNEDIEEIEYEEKYFEKLDSQAKEDIIDEYDFKMKNMIRNIFYSDDRSLLFVAYSNDLLEIYNPEKKTLIKSIEMSDHIRFLDTYITKTNEGEHIIKGIDGGFILNKDFEMTAYVPRLYDYKDGKIILRADSGKFYEVKKYTEKEIINKGKAYLGY